MGNVGVVDMRFVEKPNVLRNILETLFLKFFQCNAIELLPLTTLLLTLCKAFFFKSK